MRELITIVFLLSLFAALMWAIPRYVSHQAVLPKDILGISIGMDKDAAQTRLQEIAVFERDERKRQQVWKLKDASRFSDLAVGYDEAGKVRYVTAFVNKDSAAERIRFADVGDLSKAKAEIVEPHYRYIWDVPAEDGKTAYFVNIYGDNPQTLTIFSLAKKFGTETANTQ